MNSIKQTVNSRPAKVSCREPWMQTGYKQKEKYGSHKFFHQQSREEVSTNMMSGINNRTGFWWQEHINAEFDLTCQWLPWDLCRSTYKLLCLTFYLNVNCCCLPSATSPYCNIVVCMHPSTLVSCNSSTSKMRSTCTSRSLPFVRPSIQVLVLTGTHSIPTAEALSHRVIKWHAWFILQLAMHYQSIQHLDM